MKRFFIKVGRFFWSWDFLKFILWSITIIVLLYVEEDWRGARAWAATKAEWEAKGESFDYNRLIPPPVPDEQNLASIPLFKIESDPNNKEELIPLSFQKAMRKGMPGNQRTFPKSGNWTQGQVSDLEKIRKGIAGEYAAAFPGTSAPADPLAQLDALYPFITELRVAAQSRPFYRYPHEYPPQPPFTDLIVPTDLQIQTAQILKLQAVLALGAERPEIALSDIQINFEITSGLLKEPFIVSGLVAIGMTAIIFSPIYDGLSLHAWNDEQLVELQDGLGKLDFLAAYQNCLRGEIAVSIPMLDRFKLNRNPLRVTSPHADSAESNLLLSELSDNLWPNGWIDLNKAGVLTADLDAVSFFDPPKRLVFPHAVDQLVAETEKRKVGFSSYAPCWSFGASPVLVNAAQKFSYVQVEVDEARIACALERYHLTHNAYPDSLDALPTACIPEVPRDIINGESYRYHLRPDGTYLLYSVGWNQVDDGGKTVFKKDAPTQIDYSLGDWVWPTPQSGPAK